MMNNPMNFFDKIFVINLPERKDKLKRVVSEMDRFDIHYQVVDGIKRENGQEGIYLTLIDVFDMAIRRFGAERILVFEDDVEIRRLDFHSVMRRATEQLPEYWHMLYLGANLPNKDFVSRYSDDLLRVKRALALHAVAYSREGMGAIMALPRQLPVDLQIANFIHPMGHTYMTYPMLCTQRDDISDIEKTTDESGNVVGKKVFNNASYIEPRYNKVCEHLNLKP